MNEFFSHFFFSPDKMGSPKKATDILYSFTSSLSVEYVQTSKRSYMVCKISLKITVILFCYT